MLYYMLATMPDGESLSTGAREHGNDDMRNRNCDVGLDRRCRDLDGEIRQKRGDTLVRTLRNIYGDDFAPGVRGDMRLDTLRERTRKSLSKILKDD
jgi:hypothetical protein